MPVQLTNILTGLAFVFLTASVWLLSSKPYQTKIRPLDPLAKQQMECQTQNSASQSQLTLYADNPHIAGYLTNALCQDRVIAKQFLTVKAIWNNSSERLLQYVGHGIAQLVLAKPHLMQAIDSANTYGYRVLASYPNYSAYFIGDKEKPILSKDYFLDKRIGLLDNVTSRSGHIFPVRALNSLDLDIASLDILYASSHEDLREMLRTEKVDIIASYWQDSDQQILSQNYITEINGQISGSQWYLKMDKENRDLFCAVQSILVEHAKTADSEYYRRLQPVTPCL